MKCVLEFGNRGGCYVEAQTLPTLKLGAKLASGLVHVFMNGRMGKDWPLTNSLCWKLSRTQPRITWTSSTHFVSLTIVDDVPRGPASATLWKKDNAA